MHEGHVLLGESLGQFLTRSLLGRSGLFPFSLRGGTLFPGTVGGLLPLPSDLGRGCLGRGLVRLLLSPALFDLRLFRRAFGSDDCSRFRLLCLRGEPLALAGLRRRAALGFPLLLRSLSPFSRHSALVRRLLSELFLLQAGLDATVLPFPRQPRLLPVSQDLRHQGFPSRHAASRNDPI
jgi:hypothetical protein